MTPVDARLAAGMEHYLAAVLRPDPRAAKASVEDLLAAGARPRDVYLHVLQPALVRVGELWQGALITVAHEHLATAITKSVMARLAPTIDDPPKIDRKIILACTPGELHSVGVRMVGDFLEGDGWEVLELGAATPLDDLLSIVRSERPDAVGLSTALTLHLSEAKKIVASLAMVEPRPLILVGGNAWAGDADLARRLGADAFANDAGETSQLLRAHFGA